MASSDFIKRPKLTISEHLLILGAFFGITWILASWYPHHLEGIITIVILGYVLFWIFLIFRNTKGKIYQNAIAHFPTEIKGREMIVTKKPQISKTYVKIVDFKGYIEHRNNHNLFVAGRSGSGKSTLMRYLINEFPTAAKTIFSFKAGDEYLKLGIPILRISDHPGDPFADKEAFVQSFLVTYPMNFQGVTAASVPSLLRAAVNGSGSWKELKEYIEAAMGREKQGNITHQTYSFIQQKLYDLELKSASYGIDLNKDIVLDFSGLNEAAKTFYAELYLRQAWHSIEASPPDPMKHIIIIDETHRLLKSEATIFGEVARLIRSRGAIWCGTQNYTDLPDYVRNQFSMHLLFSTKSEKDLKALKEINLLLPFTATEIKDHHFTDAAARELHDAIPIYTADIKGFKDYEESYIRPERVLYVKTDAKLNEIPDCTGRVLKMLMEEASWSSELARKIAKENGTDQESTKFAISKALKMLQKDGLIARQTIKLKDREVLLYYKRDSAISGLHNFMQREVSKKLEEQGKIYEFAKPGEDKPDIMTKDFDIEIETGLKHDLKEFGQKLANATKKTYVVVPNEVEKDRYSNIVNATVITMSSFLTMGKI
ncbi:MAG: AAA family ATPase [Candidatus Micrarchaeaceae archaeon]